MVFSVVLGALAAVGTWREMKRARTPWSRPWVGGTVLLLIALFVTQTG
jgi:hypothetical protein